MRDVSATETAIIYGLEPVWGAAFAWVMLGERWGMAGFVGAINHMYICHVLSNITNFIYSNFDMFYC